MIKSAEPEAPEARTFSICSSANPPPAHCSYLIKGLTELFSLCGLVHPGRYLTNRNSRKRSWRGGYFQRNSRIKFLELNENTPRLEILEHGGNGRNSKSSQGGTMVSDIKCLNKNIIKHLASNTGS